jgi:hypothetical protein
MIGATFMKELFTNDTGSKLFILTTYNQGDLSEINFFPMVK